MGDRTIIYMTDWLQQIEDAHKTELESDADKTVQLAHSGKTEIVFDY
jgi:hypothetical protein